MPATLIHLHGLGSSPLSEKATVLGGRLRRRGYTYLVPDLEVPSFERLTLTAVIARVAKTVAAVGTAPVALVGSSFGGLAALHFVATCRRDAASAVERLILLAPALDLLGDADRRRQAGELRADWLDRWEADGFFDLPHSASGEQRPVHYGLAEDLRRYDSYSLALDVPTLIYHGRRDESVPYEQSVRFAESRAGVEVRLLDGDHSLSGELDAIGDGIIDFLEG